MQAASPKEPAFVIRLLILPRASAASQPMMPGASDMRGEMRTMPVFSQKAASVSPPMTNTAALVRDRTREAASASSETIVCAV